MGLTAGAGAAIAGGAALLGTGAQIKAQTKLNKKNRAWQEKMYQRTYEDNRTFWQEQNAYNTPEAQMQRFKEAGLNPNLIYGQGNAGNAGSIQSPDTPEIKQENPWNGAGQALGQGATNAINAYFDTEIKKAQIDNLQKQNTNLDEELMVKKATVMDILSKVDRTKFDLGLDMELRQTSADFRNEQLRQMRTATNNQIRDEVRKTALHSFNMTQALENILTSRINRAKTGQDIEHSKVSISHLKQSISNLKKDGVLKDWDIQLSKTGMRPSDPLPLRWLNEVIQNSEITNKATDLLKQPFDPKNETKWQRKRREKIEEFKRAGKPYLYY